jgi:hypothetical protein
MLVTLLGIVIRLIFSQVKKADSSIVIRLLGKFTVSMLVSMNAVSAKTSTPLGTE